MESYITAIGTANPRYKKSQVETVDLIAQTLNLTPAEKRLLKSVYKSSGIEYRHSVLSDYCNTPDKFTFFPKDAAMAFPSTSARMKIYQQNALDLAINAIQNCLEQREAFNKKSITHVITISCTGMYAPGLDIEIIQHFKLNSSTKRTAVNFMGCYGAFNGLKLAEAICKADTNAKVLMVSVELCTLHFQKSMTLDNVIANAIFADGAAAVLIEATHDSQKYFSLHGFYCDLLPQSGDAMTWHIADSGFDIVLSSYVSDLIASGINDFSKNLLKQFQLDVHHIDFFAIHPGGVKILEACEKALGITREDNRYSYDVLRQFGNMSSATVLFVLKAIWDDTTSENHDQTVFSCAFGPGLTLESMLLKAGCC